MSLRQFILAVIGMSLRQVILAVIVGVLLAVLLAARRSCRQKSSRSEPLKSTPLTNIRQGFMSRLFRILL